MKSDERRIYTNKKFQMLAIEIANYADEIIRRDKTKKAILLCEGRETSIDLMLYSEVYPELVVVPSNGCSDIIRLMPFMRKYSEYETFGLIDRDNSSKKRIRKLAKEQNIFCTKLPFVENIICCPEVLKIISNTCDKNYNNVLKQVKKELAGHLVEKLNYLNPFNVELPPYDKIQMVSIVIVSDDKVMQKNIDLDNIMYTFRNKSIVGSVAHALELHSSEAYCKFVKSCLDGQDKEKLIIAMAKYLPDLKPREPYD